MRDRGTGGWVYILASQRSGTLYTGVTSGILARMAEHRQGLTPGFAWRYGCTRLVWHERHGTIEGAIQRERSIKRYRRAWKLNLIEALNPDWDDLLETVYECENWHVPTFVARPPQGSTGWPPAGRGVDHVGKPALDPRHGGRG